ncbi:ArgS-related anticodon-binding protein NrtL [Streptomyces sp. NRRL F-2747]|uniref:ArgS-related anticodon-binding protein NrtL n=1 Tax=Streptomyces sp. NRRL F-2747 TaxID=1463843 RepID=UPI0004C5D005|nr:DALR anticodon-binding domain-containing protein [Streptomyces sp. NRRL F-2747]
MTPADLSSTVARAVRRAVEDGELPAAAEVPERVVIERTRPGGVGDYATPVAFQVARTARRPPAEVARVIAEGLGAEPGIERVEITGAGFLNFTLAPRPASGLVREVLSRGPRYGYADDAVEPEPFCWAPTTEFRRRAVHEAVVRILRSQGRGDGGAPPVVAPVARRDGDVAAAYGRDAALWAVLGVPARETPQFGAGLLVQDESSEFFLVRYAHARAKALGRGAARLGFGAEAEAGEPGEIREIRENEETAAPAEKPEPGEPELLRLLAEYPLVLEAAAHRRAPEQLVRFLVRVADELLDFQHCVLPKGDEKPSAAHRARLALAEAAGTVLAGGLALLGIDAPDCL